MSLVISIVVLGIGLAFVALLFSALKPLLAYLIRLLDL